MSFNLTRKSDYGLVALSFLARQKIAEGEPVSSRHLAELFGLPLQLLMNVLKDLHRADVISSRRGASGGYFLTRPPHEISLKQVIEAVEGPVGVTLCSEHGDEENPCTIQTQCPINGPMVKVNNLFSDFLEQISLVDLIENEEAVLPLLGVNV